ncbi:Mdv1p [Saccharomyces eubayanus]|uniref:Mdv1p n=1 Tax=Saccharomyces eubayanus TaxID=1080349 RepID=UPI0006C1C125|nr:MDV1-like protein [Saccharomyces eubayanus]KOG98499.1 MDV1-like protein [Saccharomyces eubayanus]
MSVNDQITHIGKTLSTTASAFLSYQKSNSSTQDVLTNSKPYQNLLSNTVNNVNSSPYLKKRNEQLPLMRNGSNTLEDIYSKTRRGDVFKNKFTDNKTCFRMHTYISDDLLNEIPTREGPRGNYTNSNGKLLKEGEEGDHSRKNTSKKEPSLFQGFKSYLPIAELAIENTEKLKDDTDDAGNVLSKTTELERIVPDLPNFQDSFLIPPGVETKKISSSYSPTALKSFSQTLVNSLEFLNIQKNSTISEVKDIDVEIEDLKQRKEKLLSKIANIEQNQLLLEDNLKQIDDRMDFLEEYGLEIIEASSDENNNIEDENTSDDAAASTNGKWNGTAKSITSETASLPTRRRQQHRDDNSSNKLGAFYSKSKKRRRRSFPTFQQLYEPGTKIGSIESTHDDFITCLDFDAPFGTLCTAGYLDHTVKIWDLSKQKKLGELAGHLATINCMQIDRDNGTLVTGGRDAALKLWNLNLAQQLYQENQNITSPTSHIDSPCVYTFESHIDEITALSLDSDFLVSGSQDRTVRQWDLRSGKCMQTIDLSFANVLSTSTNVDLSKSTLLTQRSERPSIGALQSFDAALATGTKDGVVRLWDLRSGKVIRTLEGHTDAITSLKFDSACLVTGSYDRTVRVWDLRTGLLNKFHAYSAPVLSLDFSQDNAAVVVADETSVQVYDSIKDESWPCVEPDNEINVTAVKYKENYMVEGRGNGSVHIWAV